MINKNQAGCPLDSLNQSSLTPLFLITHLPDTIIRWIGGNAHQLGEGGDEQRMRGIFMASVNQGSQGMGAIGKGTPAKQPGQNNGQNNGGDLDDGATKELAGNESDSGSKDTSLKENSSESKAAETNVSKDDSEAISMSKEKNGKEDI